jgi:hypothetical protein
VSGFRRNLTPTCPGIAGQRGGAAPSCPRTRHRPFGTAFPTAAREGPLPVVARRSRQPQHPGVLIRGGMNDSSSSRADKAPLTRGYAGRSIRRHGPGPYQTSGVRAPGTRNVGAGRWTRRSGGIHRASPWGRLCRVPESTGPPSPPFWRRGGMASGPVAEVGVAPQGIEAGLLLGGQHQEVEAVPALQFREGIRPRRPNPGDLAGQARAPARGLPAGRSPGESSGPGDHVSVHVDQVSPSGGSKPDGRCRYEAGWPKGNPAGCARAAVGLSE